MRLRIPYISILAACALALGGCAYGDFGYGGGYYGGYGYGGPYVGLGYSSGYYPYGGYGYGYDPFGWYGDYYYPGAGIYVYDSSHHRHVWNDSQRSYWTSRQATYRTRTGHTWSGSNWSGYDRKTGSHHHTH